MMKKHIKFFTALAVLSLVSLQASAGGGNPSDHSAANESTYYINAPRFVRPLIDRWISEYESLQPSAHFAIASNAAQKEESALNIQLSESASGTVSKTTFYFGKYAVIPVTAKNSDASKLLEKKELNVKKLKSLLFENDDFEGSKKKDSVAGQIVLYTGNSTFSVAFPYARHFSHDASSFRGKRIAGDDSFLNVAVAKDAKGVALNTLPNVFDLQSRRPKNDLSLVPLEGAKVLRDGAGSLDDLLSLLEEKTVDAIPTGKIGFQATGNDKAVQDFISWILTQGVQYNHQYGLLNLDGKEMAQETRKAGDAAVAAQR